MYTRRGQLSLTLTTSLVCSVDQLEGEGTGVVYQSVRGDLMTVDEIKGEGERRHIFDRS